MKIFISLILVVILSQISFAQISPNRYEVEILANPNKGRKDTRQVNSVIIFEKETVKITSRRKNEVFKEFKYADIKSVEHSYSKKPLINSETAAVILALLTGFPIWFVNDEKHWLTIVAENDFAVLKLENDNYRLIKAEFEMRRFKVENISESKLKNSDNKKDN